MHDAAWKIVGLDRSRASYNQKGLFCICAFLWFLKNNSENGNDPRDACAVLYFYEMLQFFSIIWLWLQLLLLVLWWFTFTCLKMTLKLRTSKILSTLSALQSSFIWSWPSWWVPVVFDVFMLFSSHMLKFCGSKFLFKGIFYVIFMPCVMYFSPLPQRGISVIIFNARLNLQLLIYFLSVVCK